MNELGANILADALSMVGLPGGSLSVLARVVAEEHARRISIALSTAEAMTGKSREEITEWIAADPESVPLVVRVLQAAGNTGNDRTLRALGAALARCHADPAGRSQEELIVLSLDGLTDEHLDVLAACDSDGQTLDQLGEKLKGRMGVSVLSMALMNMLPRGLFETPFGRYGGGQFWVLNELGVAVKNAALAAYPSPTCE